MEKIRLRPAPRYPDDCARIVAVMAERGYGLSVEDAEAIWDRYSDSMAAGWMGLPDGDDELFSIVKFYSVSD